MRQERIGGVIVLSGDVHTAVDIELDGGPREFVAGPLGAWPSCRIAPRIRPLLEASGRFFICDAFNCGLVTVRPRRPTRGRGAIRGRRRCRALHHARRAGLSAMTRRRTWIVLAVGAAIVLGAVLAPVVVELSLRK